MRIRRTEQVTDERRAGRSAENATRSIWGDRAVIPDAIGAEKPEQLALSIVIITENEEDRIEECIESSIAAAERAVPSFEVILVDSASTDDTIEAASDHPVTILRIPEAHTVSCGAGRFVGDSVARGELVLHVDGDMRLSDEWLAEAVSVLHEEEDVAAVEGWLNESHAEDVRPVSKVGGVMCYDADALAAVGGFDPFLWGYEDVDVGYRLSKAGYRLLRLPSVSAVHPTTEGDITEPIRRWQKGYLFAPGQAIRKARSDPKILKGMLARQRFEWLTLFWLLLGTASLFSTLGFLVWSSSSVGLFAIMSKKLGPRGAVKFGLAKVLRLAGIAYGLTLPPRSADEYPLTHVALVQEGAVLGSSESA